MKLEVRNVSISLFSLSPSSPGTLIVVAPNVLKTHKWINTFSWYLNEKNGYNSAE